ncbi:MFS transporter [Paenarthrobacter sp. Z7-10]|uniref:MFS transporter n=1 Tax=Paenarthrobacter sp. Z7-10 TaxID=2787635 RepID=UPI003FA7CB2F|nr:MFS transporter [Paenarthrobacter sp. Z7-10]
MPGGKSGGPPAARTDANDTPVDAFTEPAVRVGPRWITSVVLVNVGINVAFFGPIQVLLGNQAEAMDAQNKEAILALVTGCGAAVSLVANPLFGAFSDRTTSRFGRRVPWVLIGALLGTFALLGLAGAPGAAAMAALWSVVQLGCNGALAAITAAVPDRVPVQQRGNVGGLASMGTVLGIVGGAGVASAVGGNFALGYAVCAAALLLGVLMYLFGAREDRLFPFQRPPWSWSSFLRGFWVSPRRYPDYGWAWLTRFLVNLGNHMVTLYLLYFLQDKVHYSDANTGVFILTGIYACTTLITAVLGGLWSDRTAKRKPFVMGSSAIIALASLILAFLPTWTGAMVGAAVLGIGYGAYLAVDFALLTQVLPSAVSRGRDLGVINIANSLPQVLAPLVAFPLVQFLGGYVTLYVVAAVIGLLGAVFVVRIRGVE